MEQSESSEGPWVLTAVVCEQLEETAFGVATIHRILERTILEATWRGQARPLGTLTRRVNVCLALSSGRPWLTGKLAFDLQSPDGDRRLITLQDIEFDGNGSIRLLAPLDISFSAEGFHWLNVNFGGQVLTRIPLEMEYRSVGTAEPEQEQGYSSVGKPEVQSAEFVASPITAMGGGPWVLVATVCDDVETDHNGIATARGVRNPAVIKMVWNHPDRPMVVGPAEKDALLYLFLRSEQPGQRGEIAFDQVNPGGDGERLGEMPIEFDRHGGYRAAVTLEAVFSAPGLHWFNVVFDSRVLTRVPIQIEYVQSLTP